MHPTTIVALGAALAATSVSASPLVVYGTQPSALTTEGSTLDAKIDKLNLGGFSAPSAFSKTLNTAAAPINYGNLNEGTGMMPSQIVHYGTENQPDHGYVSPILMSTTAKEADFQLAKAEKAQDLVNADVDVGKIGAKDLGEDASKWGWG
ncbi:hypothetical protein BGZ83_010366 [Gryganskiella cystojenkinii]|nr:hypothetical protein BGZ83_010366 [Gryganskiella cystojenkinii]